MASKPVRKKRKRMVVDLPPLDIKTPITTGVLAIARLLAQSMLTPAQRQTSSQPANLDAHGS